MMSPQAKSGNGGRDTTESPDGDRMADRLLVGAAELFQSKGYAGTTTREISAKLGLQRASLYYHMEKKEDLLYDLCVSALEDVATVIEIAESEPDALGRLRKMMLGYGEVVLVDRAKHATMLTEIRSLSPERRHSIIEMRDRNVVKVQAMVEAAVESGDLRSNISPKLLTLALFNLLNWSIFWYDPKGEKSSSEIAEMLSEVFFNGVLSDGPGAS